MSTMSGATLAATALVLTMGAASVSALAQQPDIEQRRACAPDVMRLCREFVPNAELINKCLAEKKADLSPGCLAVISAPQTPPAPTPTASVPAKVHKAKYRKRSHDCNDDDD